MFHGARQRIIVSKIPLSKEFFIVIFLRVALSEAMRLTVLKKLLNFPLYARLDEILEPRDNELVDSYAMVDIHYLLWLEMIR